MPVMHPVGSVVMLLPKGAVTVGFIGMASEHAVLFRIDIGVFALHSAGLCA
jgi:hypothetical protein